MGDNLKEQLIGACETYVEVKLKTIQLAIDDLEAALKLETKCSMGDKYETPRAMLHLEFEKLAGEYEEFTKLRKTVRMIPAGRRNTIITFGSVVKTSQANYLIAIPAGELTVQGEKFYAVGASAPIAQNLKGKSAGDIIESNGRKIEVLQVL